MERDKKSTLELEEYYPHKPGEKVEVNKVRYYAGIGIMFLIMFCAVISNIY